MATSRYTSSAANRYAAMAGPRARSSTMRWRKNLYDALSVRSYPAHPASEVYPAMPESELTFLVADMSENGFDPRYPIYLLDGQIFVHGI